MLREKSGEQWRGKGADIDPHVENRKSGVTPFVIGGIEAADHRADVGLEQTGADGDQGQPGVEGARGGERHGEVAGGDDDASNQHRLSGPDDLVGNEAAKDKPQDDDQT